MGSTFNPQILVEKLAKLNNSQQSIETLSHWCIFHMNKAKQVVETWDRQFHYSRRDQRLAFLYLANDILQNSRRKGSEFVGEFWKVLPNALRDVTESGDESGRNAALRLISIWEDRKVFGSRGLILKEGLVGRHLENSNRNEKHLGFKLKHSDGNALEKIVSAYQVVYDGQLDEDAILSKCRHAITFVEKVDKEIGGDTSSGQLNESGFVEGLQGQHTILRDSIEQLRAVESTRANLVFHLREALQEQEFKLDQVRNQLQLLAERGTNEIHPSKLPHSFIGGNGEQSSPVMYTRQVPFPIKSGHIDKVPKSAAAVVAAKLTASTSSAQMLTYVLSSLASDGVIGNSLKDSSSDYPSEKRPKLENDYPSYMLPSNPQALVPSFPQPDSLQNNVPITSQESSPSEQPPPPSSPPPLPPLPPMQPYPVAQFMQTAGSITSVPYGYGPIRRQPPPPMPSYTPIGALINCVSPFAAAPRIPYPSFQGFEGGFYRPPSSLPMAPISRQ